MKRAEKGIILPETIKQENGIEEGSNMELRRMSTVSKSTTSLNDGNMRKNRY